MADKIDRYDLWIVFDPCPDEHKLRKLWVGCFDGSKELEKAKELCKRIYKDSSLQFVVWHYGESLPF